MKRIKLKSATLNQTKYAHRKARKWIDKDYVEWQKECVRKFFNEKK